MNLLFSLLVTTATARAAGLGEVSLVEGAPEFTSCFESDAADESSCEWRFYHFLSDSMVTQGFTFIGPPSQLSPALRAPAGWAVGARLDTFPFGPPPENLSGKAENTQFSPVLPRLGFLTKRTCRLLRRGVGNGGPPRYCPVFCGLKDRCITD